MIFKKILKSIIINYVDSKFFCLNNKYFHRLWKPDKQSDIEEVRVENLKLEKLNEFWMKDLKQNENDIKFINIK